MDALIKISDGTRMLAEAKTTYEALKIADVAEAYRYALQISGASEKAVREAAELKLRAERRAGQLLAEMPKASGAKGTGSNQYAVVRSEGETAPTYAEQGIDKRVAARAQKLATIPDDKFEEFIIAADEISNAAALRIAREIDTFAEIETPKLPDDKYRVIYADPPWEVGSIVLDKWESPLSDKYPTMTIDEIMTLDVAKLRADDCSLFLWTTHTFLHEAFHVIEAWGFKYHICLTWDKGGGWTNNGFHRRTEFCLYAYSGKMNIPSIGEAIPTLIVEAKREHSRKPEMIYELIEKRISAPRIELFARSKRPGWDVWGNQV